MPLKDLFDRGIGKHIILRRQDFCTVDNPGSASQSTATTAVRWKITLTRVR